MTPIKRLSRNAILVTGIAICCGLAGLATHKVWKILAMPSRSHRGALPELGAEEERLRTTLQEHVVMLASTIGERNLQKRQALEEAAGGFPQTGGFSLRRSGRSRFVARGWVVGSLVVLAGRIPRNYGY